MKKRFIRPVLLTIFILYLLFGFVTPALAITGTIEYRFCGTEANIEVCLDATNIKEIGMDFQELKSRVYHILKEKVKASKRQVDTK
jgi:hypothetical protein